MPCWLAPLRCPCAPALRGNVPKVQAKVQHAWHLYMILLNPEVLTINRAQFIEELKRRGIGTSVHFIPLHLHPFYRNSFGYQRGYFPRAEWIYDRCISLPIYPGMSDRDVLHEIESVQDVAQKHRR